MVKNKEKKNKKQGTNAEKHKPVGLDGNIKVAKVGGNVAKVARNELESNLGESIITSSNRLDYEYDNKEMITQK